MRLAIIELTVDDPRVARAAIEVACHLDTLPTMVQQHGNVLSVVTYYNEARFDVPAMIHTLVRLVAATGWDLRYDSSVGDD